MVFMRRRSRGFVRAAMSVVRMLRGGVAHHMPMFVLRVAIGRRRWPRR
jgi:hypothetical protein